MTRSAQSDLDLSQRMGRYKKETKLVRSDLWEKVGCIDSLANKLQKADILNRNTEYSSEIWSQLATDFFNDDRPKKLSPVLADLTAKA